MAEELKRIEPKLKEILYRFLEEVSATKAALYLLDEKEQFDLITQYGFRDSAPASYDYSDDIVDRLMTRRSPFFVNGLGADPRFSELLYRSDTTRILVAPVYSRGKLVGLVDLRDKAKQAPFEQPDVLKAQKIVDEFLELFAENSLFGQRPLTPSSPRALPIPMDDNQMHPDVQVQEARTPSLRVIDEARAAIARGVLRPRPQTQIVADAHVNGAALLLPAIVALPGVVLASVSPISRLGGLQVLAARSTVPETTAEQFDQKVRAWMKKRGESGPVSPRTSTVYPFGTAGPPIDPSRLQTVLSAPIKVGSVEALVLSVAFEMAVDAATRTNLEKLLAQAQQVVNLAASAEQAGALRQQLAEKLLEPDFNRFPHLVAHSKRVSELAERLAIFVGLAEDEVETVRLAALLHDVGMRVLDYRNLYRKPHPSTEEMKTLRSHPLVGAALVADSPLGADVATLILSHHERPDGTGYPDGIGGDRIPVGAKIIHICEAFDAMTANDSYQAAVPPAAAVAKIRRAGGNQFDADLATKFAEMIGTT